MLSLSEGSLDGYSLIFTDGHIAWLLLGTVAVSILMLSLVEGFFDIILLGMTDSLCYAWQKAPIQVLLVITYGAWKEKCSFDGIVLWLLVSY
jgi:hypothetical protein